MELTELKYPIGYYHPVDELTASVKDEMIANISNFPKLLANSVNILSQEELLYPYRPNGWNINEVVHHLADSHLNAFFRFKLALTEDVPTIKPYNEAKCVKLADCTPELMQDSLNFVTAIHSKWTALLKSMTMSDFERTLFHPEKKQELTLTYMLGLYNWHCNHHYGHVLQALKHKGSF